MLYFENQNLCLIQEKTATQSLCYCVPDFKKTLSTSTDGSSSPTTDELLTRL